MSDTVNSDSKRSSGRDEAEERVPAGRLLGRRSSAPERPGSGQHAHKLGRSQLLRAVNDQIRTLNRFVDGPAVFHCECGIDGCDEVVELDAWSYDVLYASTGAPVHALGHRSVDASRR